jgi:hypothetical protein
MLEHNPSDWRCVGLVVANIYKAQEGALGYKLEEAIEMSCSDLLAIEMSCYLVGVGCS